MVLNASLMEHKAVLTSAMFMRKVDPSIYTDVLDIWDSWFAKKWHAGRRIRTARSLAPSSSCSKLILQQAHPADLCSKPILLITCLAAGHPADTTPTTTRV